MHFRKRCHSPKKTYFGLLTKVEVNGLDVIALYSHFIRNFIMFWQKGNKSGEKEGEIGK